MLALPPRRRATRSEHLLALERAQLIGLVDLDHTAQQAGLGLLRQLQEPVPPAKRGARGDLQLRGRQAHDQPLAKYVGLMQPLALQTQSRQRGCAQGVEGARAAAALVALQTIGVTVAHQLRALAVRAAAEAVLPRLQHFQHLLGLRRRLQPLQQFAALRGRQSIHQREQLLHLPCIHPMLHLARPTELRSQCDASQAHHVRLSLLNAQRAIGIG